MKGFREITLFKQLFENPPRERPLNREHRYAPSNVLDFHVLKAGQLCLEVLPVGVVICCVYDEKISIIGKPVEIGVVKEAASLIGDECVLRLPRSHRSHVTGENMLKVGHPAFSADANPPHVADIKQSSGFAGRQMLLDNATGILQGHLPSRKFHHLRPVRTVPIVQGGPL